MGVMERQRILQIPQLADIELSTHHPPVRCGKARAKFCMLLAQGLSIGRNRLLVSREELFLLGLEMTEKPLLERVERGDEVVSAASNGSFKRLDLPVGLGMLKKQGGLKGLIHALLQCKSRAKPMERIWLESSVVTALLARVRIFCVAVPGLTAGI
jgi:hypothetical protein